MKRNKGNGRKRLDWPKTAICLAAAIAYVRSEDPYVQNGAAVIKKDGTIVLGYNGAPSGVDIDWSDRDERRKRVLHAEANVLNNCLPGEVEILATTQLPCCECIKLIKQKKISTVYYDKIAEHYDNNLTFALAKEYGIKLKRLDQSNIITNFHYDNAVITTLGRRDSRKLTRTAE